MPGADGAGQQCWDHDWVMVANLLSSAHGLCPVFFKKPQLVKSERIDSMELADVGLAGKLAGTWRGPRQASSQKVTQTPCWTDRTTFAGLPLPRNMLTVCTAFTPGLALVPFEEYCSGDKSLAPRDRTSRGRTESDQLRISVWPTKTSGTVLIFLQRNICYDGINFEAISYPEKDWSWRYPARRTSQEVDGVFPPYRGQSICMGCLLPRPAEAGRVFHPDHGHCKG